MSWTFIGIAVQVALFIAMCLWQLYFFRLRKQEQAPDEKLNEIKAALGACVTLKEFQEFRLSFTRWLDDNEDELKRARDDIVEIRIQLKGVQSKINGDAWKRSHS